MEDALDEVAILAEDLEGKSLAVAAAESSERRRWRMVIWILEGGVTEEGH